MGDNLKQDAESVVLRRLIVAERKALTTRATTDLVYTEGYDDALVWVLDRIDFPRLNDGSMPGGGDTVFGVPSRHGRENFPPASGTNTPLVASGEPNESDSSEKRQIDGYRPEDISVDESQWHGTPFARDPGLNDGSQTEED